MHKKLIRVSIIIGILIAAWIILRATGVFQTFKVPSSPMEPSIRSGSRIFVSNLKKPKRNSIISYKRTITENDGFAEPGSVMTFVSRLIAFENETIEIKNGLAYVNNQLVDDTTKLKFFYTIPTTDYEKVITTLDINPNDPNEAESYGLYTYSNDTFLIALSYKKLHQVKKFTNPTRKLLDEYRENDFLFENDTLKKWTVDNYGPIEVPPGCYFVLGDSRNSSLDSRFHGPIQAKNWIGNVLWK